MGYFSPSRTRQFEHAIEEQLDMLRSELASLGRKVGRRGAEDVGIAARSAEAGYDRLAAGADDLYRLLRRAYRDHGRPVVRPMARHARHHPLATIGVLAATGVIAAWLIRR